ncbi:unnamed protein product [Paramecium sonneborni]|uniref:Protein kinase domain-containing protein n=1 Tax=Paramecium sonneborni TaxID=65129 RepID=A0A8S1L417_9CILI|nr:unnamed protein product [Paramecium sonneborni]
MSKNNTIISLSINELKDQWQKNCKKDLITQIVRQPSLNQIRISKNQRSSNYQKSPNKLLNQQTTTPQTLLLDNFSLQSTISISSQIFQTDKYIENHQIQPTPLLKFFINQEQAHQDKTNISEIQTQSNSNESNAYIQTEIAKFRFMTLSHDSDNSIDCQIIKFHHVVFLNLIAQNQFSKKSESNKINHKMYMMQKLNKFKKDEMNKKIINHSLMKEPIPLNSEFFTKLEISQPVLLIKNTPIQPENIKDQQQNILDYSIEKSMILNLNFSFVNIDVEPKIQKFRQPLQQEQESQIKQELNFQIETIRDNQQFTIPNFPAIPLRFQKLKMEPVDDKQNFIYENNKLIFDQTTNIINQIKSQSIDLQLNLLKKDQIPLFQLFILIGQEQINDKKALWQDQILIKNNPNPNPNYKQNNMESDQIGINNIKVELSQNIIKESKINLQSRSKQTIKTNKFTLAWLIKDREDQPNQNVKSMNTLQFNENLLKVNYEIILPKEKPQYPSLLQMNRMKIEKIKELITEGKSVYKTKQQEKQQPFSQGIQVRQFTETNNSFKKFILHGSLILEESKEAQANKRSSSIDKDTKNVQIQRNQFQILNRFQKIKYLGRGNVSDAYSVIDQQTGMALALKTIQKSLIQSKGINNLISNEIKTQMLLNHPNILKCYGIIDDKKQIALILELSDQTLYNWIRHKVIHRKEMVDILYQVISAVNYLHNNGIIHRDIKPENILISQNVIKLADLGISIRAQTCSQYCGTLGYMAPEIKLHEKYTSKVDCYSIGVLIYEMLYKKLPLQNLYPIKNVKDDLLIDLMNKLIEPDQNFRYSCTQALNHEIFDQFIYPQLIQTSIQNNLTKLL